MATVGFQAAHKIFKNGSGIAQHMDTAIRCICQPCSLRSKEHTIVPPQDQRARRFMPRGGFIGNECVDKGGKRAKFTGPRGWESPLGLFISLKAHFEVLRTNAGVFKRRDKAAERLTYDGD